MAAISLTVDGFDVSSYIQADADEFQPADLGYVEPQYSGAPALAEGQVAIGDAVKNREMAFPLALHGIGASKTPDFADQLVVTLNSHLFRGAKVAFTLEGASSTSYFDLENGTFYPQWKHRGAGFHTFRRTCASLLFAEGRNAKQVQHWLGHHSASFTLDTYIHLLSDDVGEPLELALALSDAGVPSPA